MNTIEALTQSSGDVEIYTPPNILKAIRQTFDRPIDLDPASCLVANETVQARRFFSKEDNGLSQSWAADTLWLNHPFNRGWVACDEHCQRKTCAKRGFHTPFNIPSNTDWITKLLSEQDNYGAACCICFASTSEEWFQPLMDFPQCYLSPRTNYRKPDGTPYKGVLKGSVVTLVKGDLTRFKEAFRGFGKIKILA